MRKEARQLREKAVNSLVLSIEHFNRPWDRGRAEAVLIFLDHSLEMLLKAAIRQRGGSIIKASEQHTIGFVACIHKGLTDASVSFLTEEQASTLWLINGLRNYAQHYLVDISEDYLYFCAQSGVTLFRDIHDHVFDKNLVLELPERILPISTTPPMDLSAFFDREVEKVKNLLAPGTRKKMDAIAKMRGLAVLESAVNGDHEQPSRGDLEKICGRISHGEGWFSVFPGVASINIVEDGDGPTLSLRLTKKEGLPVQLVKESEGEGTPVVVRRVNELDYYSLGAAPLAEKVGLTQPKSRALVDHIGLRGDATCFKEIKIGRTTYSRYSPQAIKKMKDVLATVSIDDVWASHQAKRKGAR